MGFTIFIIVVAVLLVSGAKTAKANREKWKAAADVLGLGFYEGGFGNIGTISGEIDGLRVSVSTITRGSGKSSQTFTQYTMNYRERFPVDFRMSRQGFLHGVGQVFGLHDIETGNPEFDDQVLVKGGDPIAVIAFLTPLRQRKIRQIIQSYSEVVVANEQVEVVKKGRDVEPKVIVHCVRALQAFCNSMERERGADEVSLPIREAEKPVAPVLPGVEEEETLELPPADFEVSEPPPEVEESLPPKVPEIGNTLDLQETAEALFGKNSGSSLEWSRIFSEQFKGKKVSGSGVLKRVSKFSYDPVFANSKGIKASFEICRISDAYSKRKVMAVVRFPESAFADLKGRLETPMQISGQLVSLDGTMHHLYIADGGK